MVGSSRQVVGHRYFVGMHMIYGHAHFDTMERIRVDDRTIWEGSATGGRITIDAEDAFGGTSREGGVSGEVDILQGDANQGVNDYLASVLPGNVPAYRSVISAVLRQVYVGTNPYIKPWKMLFSRRNVQTNGTPQWEPSLASVDYETTDQNGEPFTVKALNPAHIIRECLTNSDWGLGYSQARIDNERFKQSAQTFFNEKLGLCIIWDTRTTIKDFISLIVQHADAVFFVDRKTGLFVLDAVRIPTQLENLATLGENEIVKLTNPSRSVFGELVTSVTVNYWDVPNNKAASVTVNDAALEQEQRNSVSNTVDYEGIADKETAIKIGQRDLAALSTPLFKCTLTAFGDLAESIDSGQSFFLDWPDFFEEPLLMTATKIRFGGSSDRNVIITAVQSRFETQTAVIQKTVASQHVNPRTGLSRFERVVSGEAPYYVLAEEVGESEVDARLSDENLLGFVYHAASKPDALALAGNVSLNDGSGLQIGSQFSISPSAILSNELGLFENSFEISEGFNLVEVEENSVFQINDELFSVISINSGIVTAKRAILDTLPTTHSPGSHVIFWGLDRVVLPNEFVQSDVVDVLSTPFSGSQEGLISNAISTQVEFDARAIRPFPPHDVRINGNTLPGLDSRSGDVTISWATRNRLIQTGGEFLGWFDGSVTSEVDVTYVIELYDNQNNLVFSENNLQGSSYVLSDVDANLINEQGLIKIFSERNGILSLNSWEIEFYRGAIGFSESYSYAILDSDNTNGIAESYTYAILDVSKQASVAESYTYIILEDI